MVRWLFAHLNIGLPEELCQKIKKHPEIKWGAVARNAMIKYLEMIEEAKKKETVPGIEKSKA